MKENVIEIGKWIPIKLAYDSGYMNGQNVYVWCPAENRILISFQDNIFHNDRWDNGYYSHIMFIEHPNMPEHNRMILANLNVKNIKPPSDESLS